MAEAVLTLSQALSHANADHTADDFAVESEFVLRPTIFFMLTNRPRLTQ